MPNFFKSFGICYLAFGGLKKKNPQVNAGHQLEGP